MKAAQITYAETFVGMQFEYNGHEFNEQTRNFDQVVKVGVVTEKKITKTGRVMLRVDGQTWSNGPIKATATLQR